MGQHLDEAFVKGLVPPPKGNKAAYDDEVKGFGVRVTCAGAKASVPNYFQAGGERRLTIGSHPDWTVKAAREAPCRDCAWGSGGE